MSRGFNLLITPLATAAESPQPRQSQDPFVHRFELEVQCETIGQPWRATLSTRGGRPLHFDTPLGLMRAISQLTLQPAVGAGGSVAGRLAATRPYRNSPI